MADECDSTERLSAIDGRAPIEDPLTEAELTELALADPSGAVADDAVPLSVFLRCPGAAPAGDFRWSWSSSPHS
jgi:hypothetical protein